MFKITQQQVNQLKGLIGEATFANVKAQDVNRIWSHLDNLEECNEEELAEVEKTGTINKV